MGWLTQFQTRRAARKMVRRLPLVMTRNWGSSKYYTPQQVRRALQETGLHGKFDFIALAAFLTPDDYDTCLPQGAHPEYDVARNLFEKELPGGFTGTYWASAISNDAAASRYGGAWHF